MGDWHNINTLLLVGCGAPAATPVLPTPTPVPPTATPTETSTPTLTPTPLPLMPTATSVPRPKAGSWKGEDESAALFTVTEDGRIQELTLVTQFGVGLDRCKVTTKEDIPIVNGGFEYSLAELGAIVTFTGTFETETTLSATYRVGMCEDTIVIPPTEGTWTASWQQP
jgi:hypothetical protein